MQYIISRVTFVTSNLYCFQSYILILSLSKFTRLSLLVSCLSGLDRFLLFTKFQLPWSSNFCFLFFLFRDNNNIAFWCNDVEGVKFKFKFFSDCIIGRTDIEFRVEILSVAMEPKLLFSSFIEKTTILLSCLMQWITKV